MIAGTGQERFSPAGLAGCTFSSCRHSFKGETMEQGYLMDDYSGLEELDDDVFHPADFMCSEEPGSVTSPAVFSQNHSYTCLLGRFQLFPLSHCCGPGIRHIEHEDKATQTLSPSSPCQHIMLPCGVTEEPRRLFYGNAGYRLHFPDSSELNSHLQEESQQGQQELSAEAQIAHKLQCIGDQFHRLHLQRVQQNRNQVWWQILFFFRNLVLNPGENRNGAGLR
ncbi:bcl-2-modifying factor isoform X2 [Rhinatrema bivittatum]|uniref:bcl-2-modifying factor isoform X2 n=1 Tax=Rhinatrema bivittatum TaxID=194408 RepID=UPI00112974ED|nr:bcl-2-modifying factor isoform X2 [Rhinatrema bivittatum]